MSSLAIIILSILLAFIAGGLYVGIRLMRSGKRRCSPARRITGGLITAAALCYTCYLGVGLWDWHESRTNPVRLFEDQLGVVPPAGVTNLQAAYVRNGGFHEYYLRWKCSAEVLAALMPKGFTPLEITDRRQVKDSPYKEPKWWDLSFATPGLVVWIRRVDEMDSYLLAYHNTSQTAWFYHEYMGGDFLQ